MARAARKVNRKTAAQLLDDHLSEDFEMERPMKAAKSSDKGQVVRVWWEPTRDKDRTGFAGAYWPAKVVKTTAKHLEVQYDNGERDKCDPENIFPYDVPIEFGQEIYDLQVGEFVEVSNNSKTDPCAWLGCVASVGKKYLVDYPFHDSPSEYIRPELLRRARVWDEVDWKYIQLGQKWKPGDVASPLELNLLTDEEYFQQLKQTFGSLKSSSKAKPESDDAAAAESEGEAAASSPEDEQQEADEQEKGSGKKRNRSRKPEKPSRAALDEASNGTSDDKPKGAKKRKPTSVRQARVTPAVTEQQQQQQPAQIAAPIAAESMTGGLRPRKHVYYDLNRQVVIAGDQDQVLRDVATSARPRVARASLIEVVNADWYAVRQLTAAAASNEREAGSVAAAVVMNLADGRQQASPPAAAVATAEGTEQAATAVPTKPPLMLASVSWRPAVAAADNTGSTSECAAGQVAAEQDAGQAQAVSPAEPAEGESNTEGSGKGTSGTAFILAEEDRQATAAATEPIGEGVVDHLVADAAGTATARDAGLVLPQTVSRQVNMVPELSTAGSGSEPSDKVTADDPARIAARSSADAVPTLAEMPALPAATGTGFSVGTAAPLADDAPTTAPAAMDAESVAALEMLPATLGTAAAAGPPVSSTGAEMMAAAAGGGQLSAAQTGSAAAPISFSDLMQNLQQPVWLMPAVTGEQLQSPAMLLLPKGCSADPAGGPALALPPSAPAAAAARIAGAAGAGGSLAVAALPHGAACAAAPAAATSTAVQPLAASPAVHKISAASAALQELAAPSVKHGLPVAAGSGLV